MKVYIVVCDKGDYDDRMVTNVGCFANESLAQKFIDEHINITEEIYARYKDEYDREVVSKSAERIVNLQTRIAELEAKQNKNKYDQNRLETFRRTLEANFNRNGAWWCDLEQYVRMKLGNYQPGDLYIQEWDVEQ
jgi:hypothetical protein